MRERNYFIKNMYKGMIQTISSDTFYNYLNNNKQLTKFCLSFWSQQSITTRTFCSLIDQICFTSSASFNSIFISFFVRSVPFTNPSTCQGNSDTRISLQARQTSLDFVIGITEKTLVQLRQTFRYTPEFTIFYHGVYINWFRSLYLVILNTQKS